MKPSPSVVFHRTPTTRPSSTLTRPARSAPGVDDQIAGPRLVADLHPRRSSSACSRSITIDAPPVSPGLGTLCPRGAGLAMFLNGQTFVAGEHEALGVGLDHGLAREVGPLELQPQRLEPIEVLHAVGAVGVDLLRLGVERHRGDVALPSPRGCRRARWPADRGSAAEIK